MFVSFHSNTMGVTCGAETTNAYGFTHNNCGVRVARFMLFCVVFCRSLFVLFSYGHCIVCPLQFMDSDYSFGIFILFFF